MAQRAMAPGLRAEKKPGRGDGWASGRLVGSGGEMTCDVLRWKRTELLFVSIKHFARKVNHILTLLHLCDIKVICVYLWLIENDDRPHIKAIL